MADETIRAFGNRSNLVVSVITFLFAVMPGVFFTFGPGRAAWVMWIPFCFITIAPIHMLCRRILDLSSRLRELEKVADQMGPVE